MLGGILLAFTTAIELARNCRDWMHVHLQMPRRPDLGSASPRVPLKQPITLYSFRKAGRGRILQTRWWSCSTKEVTHNWGGREWGLERSVWIVGQLPQWPETFTHADAALRT